MVGELFQVLVQQICKYSGLTTETGSPYCQVFLEVHGIFDCILDFLQVEVLHSDPSEDFWKWQFLLVKNHYFFHLLNLGYLLICYYLLIPLHIFFQFLFQIHLPDLQQQLQLPVSTVNFFPQVQVRLCH